MAYPSDLTRTKNWGTEILTDADLEGQLDLIINWAMAVVNASTGHTHDGTSNNGPKIPITNLTVGSQALGDIIYSSSSTAMVRLAGNTTATKKFLTQTGDGSLSAAPSWGTLISTDMPSGSVLQVKAVADTAIYTDTTHIPWTQPAISTSNGTEATGLALAITPGNASNNLLIRCVLRVSSGTGDDCTVALFQDSTTAPLATTSGYVTTNSSATIVLEYFMAAGTTSETTFKIRFGQPSSTCYTNSIAAGTQIHNGKEVCSMMVMEIKA